MLRKNVTSRCQRPAPEQATSGQSPEARTGGGPDLAKSVHMADKERTRGGHTRRKHKSRRRGQSGHLRKKAGRDMPWPRPQSLSAMPPPCDCLVSALCPP